MKATKYTLQLTAQGLSKDIFAGMLHKVIESLQDEVVGLGIEYDDGDQLTYTIDKEEVTF